MDKGSDSPPAKTSSLKVIELSEVILRTTLKLISLKAQVLCAVRLRFHLGGGRQKRIEGELLGFTIMMIFYTSTRATELCQTRMRAE
jgi:hypothetical protein